MKETLSQILKQTSAFYRGLTPGRRLSLLVIAVVTVVGFGLIISFISHEEMRPLAAGLAPEDVQAVARTLRENNVPCTISPSGDAVLVPAGRLDQARLELASAGLPRGGSVGFELFDQGDLGMTEFRERVNFRRALEGELARTIRSLGEVRSARVHIVIPQKALFREDEKESSASVVINLLPGRILEKRQIRGIRYLVSSAVEGLRPERVTVLDGQGAILARMGEAGSAGSTEDRIEYQRSLEQRLESRVLGLLEPLVGTGKVVAQVTADVDFQRVIETTEQFDPERTAVRSEQRSEEKRTGTSSSATGVAGARSNLPGGPGPGQPDTGKTGFQRNSEMVNYEVDKTIRRTERPQGSLRRLSVAVVVDGTYQVKGEGEQAETVYRPRTKEEIDRLAALVKKAIGFDSKRGDQVEVSNIAFQVPEVTESSPSFFEGLDLNQIIRILALVVLGLILLFAVVRPALRAISRSSTDLILPLGRQATVVELERDLVENPGAPALLPAGQSAAAEGPARAGIEARRLSRANPQRTVQVLRGWLDRENP